MFNTKLKHLEYGEFNIFRNGIIYEYIAAFKFYLCITFI